MPRNSCSALHGVNPNLKQTNKKKTKKKQQQQQKKTKPENFQKSVC